jgi:hypothetical protein
VITRTQVWRSQFEKKGPWYVTDLNFFLDDGTYWGYGSEEFFSYTADNGEAAYKMALSNQAARKSTKKQVCTANGMMLTKTTCNAEGFLGDLRTCGKCFKVESDSYAYMAKDSMYIKYGADTKYTVEAGYYSSKDLTN